MLNFGQGHPRLFNTDLNLLAQIITFLIIIVSLYYKRKGKIKHHGTSMTIAVILHLMTFILVMGPIFSQSFSFFSSETTLTVVQTIWLHAIPGIITLILAIYLVAIWVIKPSNITDCYKRRKYMDLTIVLWLFSLTFGILSYVFLYF
jgi:uncharacterized membrane protein YozB (DUF420 family)